MFFAQYCGTSTLIYCNNILFIFFFKFLISIINFIDSTLIFEQATEGDRRISVYLTIMISGFTPMVASLLSGFLV
jgi:hypothetical protein